jgi:hypothetical protein
MCERPQTTTTISKRVPDGDGNRLKGVEVGVTAGEILRDGGLALPPTPASPSRSARGKEWRKRWGRKGEETIGEWRAKQVQVRIKRQKQNRKFVKKRPQQFDDVEIPSKFWQLSTPPGQVNKQTHENQHTHTLLRIKKAITISKRQEPSVHRDGQWRHWEKRFRFVLLVEKKSLTAEIHERSATT